MPVSIAAVVSVNSPSIAAVVSVVPSIAVALTAIVQRPSLFYRLCCCAYSFPSYLSIFLTVYASPGGGVAYL